MASMPYATSSMVGILDVFPKKLGKNVMKSFVLPDGRLGSWPSPTAVFALHTGSARSRYAFRTYNEVRSDRFYLIRLPHFVAERSNNWLCSGLYESWLHFMHFAALDSSSWFKVMENFTHKVDCAGFLRYSPHVVGGRSTRNFNSFTEKRNGASDQQYLFKILLVSSSEHAL